MRPPRFEGIIRRRLLVNFRVDASVAARLLPEPFEPQLHRGYAIAGICMIRLERIRPRALPEFLGLSSDNAAHRFAVRWHTRDEEREGVWIPRRDTSSRIAEWAGGRLFPGDHYRADFDVQDDGDRISLAFRCRSDATHASVRGARSSNLPSSSLFSSVDEASQFFAAGSLGWSPRNGSEIHDGVELHTMGWHVDPFDVEQVASSYFDDRTLFPAGTATFDHALVMRDIEHEWRPRGSICGAATPEPQAT